MLNTVYPEVQLLKLLKFVVFHENICERISTSCLSGVLNVFPLYLMFRVISNQKIQQVCTVYAVSALLSLACFIGGPLLHIYSFGSSDFRVFENS